MTERVRTENHQRLLIHELNHRVKNTLASIQSIVSQTLRGSATKQEASQAITARIMALSGAHNVLTRENWNGADLHLGPRAAMAIALAIHELATNAVKYGALSLPQGRVMLCGHIGPQNGFRLEWRERGGPQAAASDRGGFGSRLILQVLPQELQGRAEMAFLPEGMAFSLATSVAALSDVPVYTEDADGAHSYR